MISFAKYGCGKSPAAVFFARTHLNAACRGAETPDRRECIPPTKHTIEHFKERYVNNE